MGDAAPILSVHGIDVTYGDVIRVLHGVSLQVDQGAIVALLGANGAGKTTLLRACSGLLRSHRGAVTSGMIKVDGERVENGNPAAIVRRGLAQVMEGRRIFAELSVDENLRAGAYTRRDRAAIRSTYAQVMEMFPILARRHRAQAGYLSGGEQQMLAIARALMASPRLLLLDEPSLGLAPMIVDQIRDIIVDINAAGTSVLLVEQNAAMALSVAAWGYVMETGRIVKEGAGPAMLSDPEIRTLYLGISEHGRRSFRDTGASLGRRTWIP